VKHFVLTVAVIFGVLALASCASTSVDNEVRVISALRAAPTGCKDLGPVSLTRAAALNTSPVSNPNDELLRLMTQAKGGNTLHYTGVFPLRGEAYNCPGT